MKKIWGLFLLLFSIILVGCSNSNGDISAVLESDTPIMLEESQKGPETTAEAEIVQPETTKNEEMPKDLTEIPEFDEVGLPKMKYEYQTIYDQYINPFIPGNSFFRGFEKDDFTFFNVNRIYSCIAKSTEFSLVPQDIVEKEVAKFFPITSEQMRSISSSREYDPNLEVYDVPPYQFSNHTRGVVVDYEELDGRLYVTCDWYTTVYTDDPPGPYSFYATSQFIIDSSTGAFISNKVAVG